MARSNGHFADLRNEVREYVRSCEQLLSLEALTSAPLSADECEIVEYYLEELRTHLLGPKTH